MELNTIIAIGGLVLGVLTVVNTWAIVIYSGLKKELKAAADTATVVAVLVADMSSLKEDMHISSGAVLESFDKLDARLHSVILQLVGNKK
jgi:hypothetical protein